VRSRAPRVSDAAGCPKRSNRGSFPLAAVVVLAFTLLVGARSEGDAGKERRPAPGLWGGPHVWMEVRQDGAALEFDCAHGTIDEPPVADSSGRFDWKGTYVREHGGPVSPEIEVARPARYRGEIDGETLHLITVLADSGEELGNYMLRQGVRSRLAKCV
jgi:hypothetical protein